MILDNVKSAAEKACRLIEKIDAGADPKELKVGLYGILNDCNDVLFPGEEQYPAPPAETKAA